MTRRSLRYVHLDECTVVTSQLSQRTVRVNTSVTKLAITDLFSREALASARTEWENAVASLTTMHRMHGSVLALYTSPFECSSASTFADAIDSVLHEHLHGKWTTGGIRLRFGLALVAMRNHDLIAFPAGEWLQPTLFIRKGFADPTENLHGIAARFALTLAGATNRPRRWEQLGGGRSALRLFAVAAGAREPADYSEEVLFALREVMSGRTYDSVHGVLRQRIVLCVDALLRAQAVALSDQPNLAATVLRSARALQAKQQVADGLRVTAATDATFTWIAAHAPTKREWQSAAADYVASLTQLARVQGHISALNTVFRRLLFDARVPDSPLPFCERSRSESAIAALRDAVFCETGERRAKRDAQRLQALVRTTREFLDAILTSRVRVAEGGVERSYHNPAEALTPPRQSRSGRTTRKAMPASLQAFVISCLTDPVVDKVGGKTVWSFDWARTQPTDYFDWYNPDTGVHEQVWSPVRALFLLLLLHLPLRTMSLRMLGSGEGDPFIWVPNPEDPASGCWEPNQGPWAPVHHNVEPHGFLRRMYVAGEEHLGLYVSSNKTTDRATGFTELGYEIPFAPPVVRRIVGELLLFQNRYNPPLAPKRRTELSTEKDKGTSDMQAIFPPMHYLLRDPAGEFPDEPMTKGRLWGLWRRLLEHVEDEAARFGKPLSLIVARSDRGYPSKLLYDLHSCRVTGVTALALKGCPLPVISALVGHSTVVMTAYYIALSDADVQRELSKAFSDDAVPIDGVQTNWRELARTGSFAQLDSLLVSPSGNDGGVQDLKNAQRLLVRQMDIGYCPNGGSMCATGGAKIASNRAAGDRFGPVPGGNTNCASCRYFVTGPLFLCGLVARFNADLVEIEELRTQVVSATAAYEELLDRPTDASPTVTQELRRLQELKELSEERLVAAGERAGSLFRAITLSTELMRSRLGKSDGPVLLINEVPSHIDATLSRSSDFERWNRVCLDAEVFAIDGSISERRRWRDMERVLVRSGLSASPLTLSDDELRFVGNQLFRYWKSTVGGEGVQALLNETATLESLGLADTVRAILEQIPSHSARGLESARESSRTRLLLPPTNEGADTPNVEPYPAFEA